MKKYLFIPLLFFSLLLIIVGCSKHEPTTEEIDLFFESILLNEKEQVEAKLKDGIDPNIENEDGYSALLYAIFVEHFEIAELLIDKGAKYDHKTIGDNQLLMEASYRGATEVVKQLLSKGNYDVNDVGDTNWPPLLEAIRLGHEEIVELLLQEGASSDFVDENGWTALHEAAYSGHTHIIQLLLEKGADATVKNDRGFTPLHVAALGGYPGASKLLIENNQGLVNELDNHQRTPLMIASEQGFIEVVNILLEKGADIHMKSEDGKTASEMAEEWGHIEVVEVIRDYK